MFLPTIPHNGRWCEPSAIGATHWVLPTYDNSLSCRGISKSFFPHVADMSVAEAEDALPKGNKPLRQGNTAEFTTAARAAAGTH